MEYQIIKKGRKRVKLDDYNKTKNLIILALDCSGSMTNGEQYVDAVMGGMVEELKTVAAEHGIKINLSNLKGCMHNNITTNIVDIDSNEWRNNMDRFNAWGGNDFTTLYNKCVEYKERLGYENLIIINLGDGLDIVAPQNIDKNTRWIDAIFANEEMERDYMYCCEQSRGIKRETIYLA